MSHCVNLKSFGLSVGGNFVIRFVTLRGIQMSAMLLGWPTRRKSLAAFAGLSRTRYKFTIAMRLNSKPAASQLHPESWLGVFRW